MACRVRIYRPAKTAMQSGMAGTGKWRVDFENDQQRQADPLMGWIGGGDTQSQVWLHFDTQQEAMEYVIRHGLDYDLELPHPRRIKPKAYADNFKFGRWENWTH